MTYSSLGIAALEVRTRAVEFADPAVRQIAQDLADQGNTAFRAGDYDTAIRRYTDAWALFPAQNVLLLIGLTMMRQGRYQDALYRFQRYLRESPDGEQRQLAQEQLANAQAALGPVGMNFTEPAEVPPQVMAQARRTIQVPQQAQQLAPPPTSLTNPYAPRTNYAPWVAAGVGILGIIGIATWAIRRRG